MLSALEQKRYLRHILLKQIGGEGQAKLKQSNVLMVGAGGLGASCLFYLAAAGVGTIGIIDDDKVSLDNLQRQILYSTADIDKPKVHRAKEQLHKLNPEINLIAYEEKLEAHNALRLFEKYDFIADGTDNVETRFLINDVCFFAERHLTSAAVGAFNGQVASFRAFDKAADGTPFPSWRCLVGEIKDDADNCDSGVMGALCGILGSLQALELIKQITGAGDTLLNKLLLYDGLSNESRLIKLKWDRENPLNGARPRIKREDFC